MLKDNLSKMYNREVYTAMIIQCSHISKYDFLNSSHYHSMETVISLLHCKISGSDLLVNFKSLQNGTYRHDGDLDRLIFHVM